MIRDEIKEKLIELCVDIFCDARVDKNLIENKDFFDDLGMDSIMFITLIIEIEAVYEITVTDSLLLMDNFKNLDNVVQVIEDQLAEKVKENEADRDD